MDSSLLLFLRHRGVPEENLLRMKEEHIDATVIGCMDDGALSGYIPVYGDRIVARHFCLKNKGTNTKDSKKHSQLDKLKRKMAVDSDDDTNSDQAEPTNPKPKRPNMQCNKLAEKRTRRIDLGWFHEGRQVRKRKGGGTWAVEVLKDSKKSDLIDYCKDLFFPNGECRFGRFETFSHDLLDFKEEAVLDDNTTVGELYAVKKLGMLRLYLYTKSLISLDGEDNGGETCLGNNLEMMDMPKDEQVTETIAILSSDFKLDPDALSNTSEVTFSPVHGEPMAGELDDTLKHQPTMQFEGDESGFRSVELASSSTAHFAPAPGDEASTSTASYEMMCATIKLHRSNLFEEMIEQFKEQTLLRQTLKFSFVDERGADQDGVSIDAYATFWTEFMDRIADGEDVRVPTLPVEWDKEEWKSIGRILLKGFKDHGYFPCRLAPAFSVALIFGESEVSDEMLFESLLLYIGQQDRDLVTTALNADCLDEDLDELIDLLYRFNVKLPIQKNLKRVLLNVARNHLIQKPNYAAQHMSSTARHILKESFSSPQAVLQMYEEKKPTTSRFLKLLDASPATEKESRCFRFLQQYIRGLDDAGLRRMLRFATGSDVICVNKIKVLFTPVGLERRPIIAHTCGPALELPQTYGSYSELHGEMDSILLHQNSIGFSIV